MIPLLIAQATVIFDRITWQITTLFYPTGGEK